jgi:hypothetical protein
MITKEKRYKFNDHDIDVLMNNTTFVLCIDGECLVELNRSHDDIDFEHISDFEEIFSEISLMLCTFKLKTLKE